MRKYMPASKSKRVGQSLPKPRKPSKTEVIPVNAAHRPPRFAEPMDYRTPPGMRCDLEMTVEKKGGLEEKWKLSGQVGEEPDEVMARMRTSPAYTAAEVIHVFNGTPNDTLRGMVNELDRQAKAVNGGDLSQMEAMLATQAHTLDALFTRLAKRAHDNFNERFEVGERFLRLALKAQSQSRATVESLGQLKNPAPVAFVKQANIAAGHQQVNNGSASPPRAGEIEITPSKLLEAKHGERLDTGAASASGRANQALEAVGKVNRTEDGCRKGAGRKKRR